MFCLETMLYFIYVDVRIASINWRYKVRDICTCMHDMLNCTLHCVVGSHRTPVKC